MLKLGCKVMRQENSRSMSLYPSLHLFDRVVSFPRKNLQSKQAFNGTCANVHHYAGIYQKEEKQRKMFHRLVTSVGQRKKF